MVRLIGVGDKQPFTLRVNHIASGVLPLWEGKSGRKRSGRYERVDLADSVALLSVCCIEEAEGPLEIGESPAGPGSRNEFHC